MPDQKYFSKEDIGGEILPILTTGLYRDSLDALREYVQNAIDADATKIEIKIDPSTVAVNDDGSGMTKRQAERAIRLGLSDKNPVANIGFRGIGVYSAFNLCELLEIFTKPARGPGSHIVFHFDEIRKALLEEEERRKVGLPPKLYLEKLLESHVYVQPDDAHLIPEHGTKVLLSNLLPESYKRLQNWEDVEPYLQDVVPLPFHPDFHRGVKIQQRFTQEDYRVVPLTLQIGSQRAEVFRPYTDSLFPDGKEYLPKFFTLKRGDARFGFAWVCINGRRVIRDTRMRGLLIKKFGFSVGKRGYLEPFFKRTVFNRRITGEIIVQHPGLIPNAARSDFENNAARQEFLSLLPTFIGQLSAWADTIQQDEKAVQVLEEVMAALEKIAAELPTSQRDKDVLLRFNVDLADHEHRLTTHKRTLEPSKQHRDEYKQAVDLLKKCKALVRDALSSSAESRKRLEQDVVKIVQAEAAMQERQQPREDQPARDLTGVLDAAGIQLHNDARHALRLFESEYLLGHLESATYQTLLKQLQDALEEGA